jgi:CubicO group peptidase (beta-lactamase class C family)
LASVPDRFSPGASVQFTLRDLAQHEAGLRRGPPCDHKLPASNMRSCDVSSREILQRWARAGGPVRLPNSQAYYSNFGIALLGHALAASQGHANDTLRGFDRLVHAHVLNPLHMNATGFGSVLPPHLTLARAYASSNSLEPLPFASTNAFMAPSYGAYSTALDLAKLASAALHVSNTQRRGNAILLGSTMTRAEQASAVFELQPSVLAYGMGFDVSATEYYGSMVSKNGMERHDGDTVYSAYVGTLPTLGIGISMALSGGAGRGPGVFAAEQALLDTLAPAAAKQLAQLVPFAPPVPASVDITPFLGAYFVHGAAAVPLGPVTLALSPSSMLEFTLPKLVPLPSGPYQLGFDSRVPTEQLLIANETRLLFTAVRNAISFCPGTDDQFVVALSKLSDTCIGFLLPFLGPQITAVHAKSSSHCIDALYL